MKSPRSLFAALADAVTGAFLVASVLIVVGNGQASAQSKAQSTPWRHALIQPKSDAGILTMPAQGGFFKKVGLDVDVTNVKDDEILLHALIAGDLDSFEGGPGAALIADAHGADVKIVGCSWLMVPHGALRPRRHHRHGSAQGQDHRDLVAGRLSRSLRQGRARSLQRPGGQREIRQPRRRSRSLQGAGGEGGRCRGGVGRIHPDRREGAHQDAGVGQGRAAAFHSHVPADDRRDAEGAARRCREIPGRRNARPALCRGPQGRGRQSSPKR